MKRIAMLYNTKRGKYVYVNLDYKNKKFEIINKVTNEDITDCISQTERKEICDYIQNIIREGKMRDERNF